MDSAVDLSIFIPVLDEELLLESSCMAVHEHLRCLGVAHELVVVSNGSTDRTAAIGEDLARRYPEWFRFDHLPQRGAGAAFKRGVRMARGRYLATLDVDLSSDLVFLQYALTLLPYSDMVLGSKTMGVQRRTPLRIIGSQLYILFTQLLFNLTLSDYSIGCKAFHRERLLPLVENLDDWTGYILELALLIQRGSGKIVQIGVDCDDRRESRFSLIHEGFYRYRHLFRTWRRFRSMK